MAAELERTSRREGDGDTALAATSSSLMAAVDTWRLPLRDNRRGEDDLGVRTTTAEAVVVVVVMEEDEEDALAFARMFATGEEADATLARTAGML